MPSPVLFSVCFGGVVCLAPVAFYLCWLASVNRRERPTVVNGAWDFAGVLAALSGFLLVGGLLLRAVVLSDPRLMLVGRTFVELRIEFEKQWLVWLGLVFGYLLGLGLIVRVGVRTRVTTLSVYHIHPEDAAAAVGVALESSRLTATRAGNLWSDGRRLVELIPFHGTRHATVRLLSSDRRLREEIERHLRDQLARVASSDNPAGVWFSTLAGGSVLAVVGLVALAAYTVFLRG